MNDPIVEEIRKYREEHAARFNYDLDTIIADIQRSQAARDWPIASFEPQRITKRSEDELGENRETLSPCK